MKQYILLISLVTIAFVPAIVCSQSQEEIQKVFEEQSISLNARDVEKIRGLLESAVKAKCSTAKLNSRVKFSAAEIALELKMNPAQDSSLVRRIAAAVESLPCLPKPCDNWPCPPPDVGREGDNIDNIRGWEWYYERTINLNSNSEFLRLVAARGFHPVKISWEDISRYQGSVWGDRISDVGIWVRKYESDPSSAQLALSLRRDSNYHDKVLMVPAEAIKIHLKNGIRTEEISLPRRLNDLGLDSRNYDKHVIVSNQFAIVPVPKYSPYPSLRSTEESRFLPPHPPYPDRHAPRVAFTFSIFPYGSTNYVITDVIEGSSDAIVGPGNHQLLYADIDGQKAPFTASRAAERPDLLALENELKGRGMDVDVQRYYLIQIPLRRDASGIQLSNLGTPPFRPLMSTGSGADGGVFYSGAASAPAAKGTKQREVEGTERVAIGHGETEGYYNVGSGYRGTREEAPVRVTVVYFVTPKGELTEEDMNLFSRAFEQWDAKAIWGGSFVEP